MKSFFSFEYCDFVLLLKWRRWVFLSIFFSSHEKIVCVWLPSEWWKGEGRCDIGYIEPLLSCSKWRKEKEFC